MSHANPIDPQWQQLISNALPQKPQLALQLSANQEDLSYLSLRACIRSSPQRTLELQLANSLTEQFQPFESHRVYSCLKIWTPLLIKLHRKIKADFKVDLSMCDGGAPNVASMDCEDPTLLLPDLYAMQAALNPEKYGRPLPFPRFLHRWQQKVPLLFWRGGTTGIRSNGPITKIEDLEANLRVKTCLEHRKNEMTDIKISRVVQLSADFSAIAEKWLSEQTILAPSVNEADFGRYRFYPDIPGNALAWGTIFKHLRGCLVFRSTTSRSLYYYRLMQPWKHYIPVKPDFSDTDAAISWAQAHPEEAGWIAWRGHQVAHRYLRQIGSHFCDGALSHIKPLLNA